MGFAEIELIKERFSKLLLGEDMSGCGNGVCTSLAISNAITNLCGMVDRPTLFLVVALDLHSLTIVEGLNFVI